MASSAIQAFEYDPERRELLVTFTTGRRYIYADVPEHVAIGLERASSLGRYFNWRIRDQYEFREIE